jgi:hypothetical protein
MATNYSPTIVTDGVVEAWDPLVPSTNTSATLLYDRVGSTNGTMFTGASLDFDGSNDYVQNSSFTDHQSSSGTIVAWAKADSLTGGTYIFGVGGTTTYGATRAMRFTSSKLSLVGYGSGTEDYNDFGPTLVTGQWYHVAYVWSGTSITGYVDGVGYSTTRSGLVTPTGTNVTAGQAPWVGNYFNGQVADARMYNVALSAANIKELYNDSKVIIPSNVSQTNLKAWWPLTEGAGTIAYDGSRNGNDGTLTNMTSADWLTGQTGCPQLVEGYNRPVKFANGDYVNVLQDSSLDIGTNDFTACGWWYGDPSNTQGPMLFMQFAGAGGWRLVATSAPAYRFTIFDNGWTNYAYKDVAVTLGQWNHIAVSADRSGTAVCYLNGVAIGIPLTISGVTGTLTNAYPLRIGSGTYTSTTPPVDYTYGVINECIIYNGIALNATDIAALAATDANGGPLPPDPITMTYSTSSYSSSYLKGYWRNDGNVTWTDRSGNSNTGTVTGGPKATLLFKQGINGSASTSTGRDNQGFPLLCKDVGATGYNGTSHYINLGNSAGQIAGLGSLDAWVYPTEDKWMYFFFKGYGSANSLFLGGHTGALGSGKWGWMFGSYDGGYNYHYWGTAGGFEADYANRWHHLTMTFNKSLASANWKVYWNGEYNSADNWTSDLGTGASSALIGYSRYWAGQIGPIRTYNRVLSPDEIKQNYNAQKSRFT